MRRRGFLSFMGVASGAAATGAAFALPKSDESKGVYVQLKCERPVGGGADCDSDWRIFVDLTGPIVLGSPQCPRCLQAMAWPQECAQQIKKWNLDHGLKTTIYTPSVR